MQKMQESFGLLLSPDLYFLYFTPPLFHYAQTMVEETTK